MVATSCSAPNSTDRVNIGRQLLLLADWKRIMMFLSPSYSWVIALPTIIYSNINLNYCVMFRISWWLSVIAYASGRACLQAFTVAPRSTYAKYPTYRCVKPQSIPVNISSPYQCDYTTLTDPFLFLSIVRNDFVSKPLSKGILDGNLLAHYETLPITRQNEMTRQIGTERLTLLRDWISLSGAW